MIIAMPGHGCSVYVTVDSRNQTCFGTLLSCIHILSVWQLSILRARVPAIIVVLPYHHLHPGERCRLKHRSNNVSPFASRHSRKMSHAGLTSVSKLWNDFRCYMHDYEVTVLSLIQTQGFYFFQPPWKAPGNTIGSWDTNGTGLLLFQSSNSGSAPSTLDWYIRSKISSL